MTSENLYQRVGGTPFFERLVDLFYDGISRDELLAPMYPDFPNMGPARHRLTLFLVQYWGGPTTYMEERGHPRLRMRHFPFRIGTLERDRWLIHMAAAVQLVCAAPEIPEGVEAELMGYFVPSAEHMRNDGEPPLANADSTQGHQ